jgi:hypothetical protein
MTEARLDELFYTLDICAESLPFDLQAVHIRRLEIIRAILSEHQKEKERKPLAPVLSLVERSGRNDATDRDR